MIRLAWRQFRTEAAVGLGVLVVVAVVLALTGPHLVDVYRTTPSQVTATHHSLQIGLAALLLVVPALVGVFFGAPLVARELEAGTYRLAWTQSVTRVRWLVVKLAFVGLASSLLAGGLSLMVAWWANPINIVNQSRFSPANFGMFGVVPFGYALFAFALGVTTGVLFRRMLPAMTMTLGGYLSARRAVTFWIRPHFVAPLGSSFALDALSPFGFQRSPSGLQIVLQSPTIPELDPVDGRRRQGRPRPDQRLREQGVPGPGKRSSAGARGRTSWEGALLGQMQQCSTAIAAKFHGVVTYQPATRYRPFQIYETALFVLLALAFAGVSFWWVRRRLA